MYRAPKGYSEEEAIQYYIDKLLKLFDEAAPASDVAAIIIEPLQGEGGFIPAPIEFVKKLRKICDDNGIMLIADEVQCGNCRTGKYFTSEYWKEAGAAPDIIATAKSMGAGVPISAISAREEVMDAAPAGTIGGTYCGNPLACAAAIKTMEIMKEEDYCAKSIHIGSVVRKAFEKMKEKYDIIGDVRGIGGMLGIEFVKDKERKEPNPEFVSKLVQTALQKGLLLENAGSFGNVIRFLAPLCMTEEQMETGLKILRNLFWQIYKSSIYKIKKEGSIMEFNYFLPVNLVFGSGKVLETGELAKPYGKKALIVTGRSSAKRSGLYDKVNDSLKAAGLETVLFDKVSQNPLTTTAQEGADFAKANGCDVVVAIGGGSIMDCAKAIAFFK